MRADWTFKITIDYLGHKWTREVEQGDKFEETIQAIEECASMYASRKLVLEEPQDA